MHQKRRGILAFLALSGLMAVAIGGVILFFSRDLPDPAKANQKDLLRWLIAKDIENEPAQTQSVLAQRLESEFAEGVDWSLFKNKISDAQREQLSKNIPCVLRAWFLDKADAYERAASGQRMAFLDRLIDTLEVWQGVEKLLPKPSANAPDAAKSLNLSKILTREMEKLRKSVPDSRQKQIDQLWMAVQVRWFLRNLAPKK